MNADQQRITKLQALSKVSIAVSECLEVDEVLYNAVVKCIEVLQYDTAVIYFLDADNEYFEANHYYGLSQDSFEKLRILTTDGICGEVLNSGRTQLLVDLGHYYNIRPQLREEGFVSTIAVPIKDRAEVKGVLIASSKSKRKFGKDDIALMESIGLQIGVARVNANLFRSVEIATLKLQELVELTNRISSIFNLDELFESVERGVERLFCSSALVLCNTYGELGEHDIYRLLIQDGTIGDLNNGVQTITGTGLLEQVGLKTALLFRIVHFRHKYIFVVGKNEKYEWSAQELEIANALNRSIDLSVSKISLINRLKESEQLNTKLLAKQVLVQENERQRIALDMHDFINQSLVGMNYHLRFCLDNLHAEPQHVSEILKNLLVVNNESVREIRNIIEDLRPPAIEKYGLVGAVEELTKKFNRQKSGALLTFTVSGIPIRLGYQTEIYLYRVIQEALNNIQKHSQADRAFLKIVFGEDLEIELNDNGLGFNYSSVMNANNLAFGLTGIKKRIEDLGGIIDITSNIGTGTRIKINIRLAGSEHVKK